MLGEAVDSVPAGRPVEATWRAYWPPGKPNRVEVLAGGPGRAVLDAVAEEEGVAGTQWVPKSSSATRTPVSWSPAESTGAAVLQGVHGDAARITARVAVVDAGEAVDAVAVGPHDVVGLAARQPRRAPIRTHS